MAKFSVLGGATSQSDVIFIQDSSSTTGAGLSGLAFNTSGLTAYYSFAGANATATAITLATLAAVNSAWSSGGFKELDATNMKGWYRFDIPNAAIATAKGRIVGIHFQGATNMAPCAVAYELTGWDNQDATNGGLSKLTSLTFTGANKVDASVRDWIGGTIPAVNVTGVPLVDLKYTLGTISPAAAGSVGIDWAQVANKGSTVSLTATTIATTTTVTNQLTAAAIATGIWQDTTAGDFTTALSVGKSVMNGVTLGTGLTIAAVSGAVGSVTARVTANTDQWAGSTVAAVNTNGVPIVDMTYTRGTISPAAPGLVRTDGLPSNFSALLISAGGHISNVDTLTTYTGNTVQTADVAALNNISTAQVKTQVVAALNTDTYAEPAQGTPAATTTLAAKINYLFKAWRNKTTQTASTYSLFNDDAATVDHKAAVSDDATTFTRGEIATGP